ncbi:DUF3027 domain-containing protein [Cellulomonas fimi]|uniref:DUF3027 domain-containing protein n=1 Tax=Cellulomonas fimi TaxID=1708 RepID=A0A7Y0LXX7_CELFI|nr:DUF3027 domain-containing protein [Cellulomonas fimi]NMR20292.1 DUF3027 domain-containing protein [Cellulomonas fimi]
MATATKDAVLTSALDLARDAALEAAENPAHVGDHLGVVVEGERLVSHRFACTAPGYRGWHWTVTLARAPRARVATVCESELLPGPDAILAREWVPWSERLRPGDIGPGDVLPFRADDPRLEPGYTPTGDEEQDFVAIEELALARARVLSPEGRRRAAERWYAGAHGPTTPGAVAAAASCQTCGFLVPLSGELGQLFGVCTNEWSPDDGKVVSLDHGCGAHSQTDLDTHPSDWPAPSAMHDELDVELVSLLESSAARDVGPERAADDAPAAPDEPAPSETASAPADEIAAELADVDPALADDARNPEADAETPGTDAETPGTDAETPDTQES